MTFGGAGVAGTPPPALAAVDSLLMPKSVNGIVVVTVVAPDGLDLSTGAYSVRVTSTSAVPAHAS